MEHLSHLALKLQQAGVIRYQRGSIVVLDRKRLEQRTCECYAAVTKEHHRLLPTSVPSRYVAPMPIAA